MVFTIVSKVEGESQTVQLLPLYQLVSSRRRLAAGQGDNVDDAMVWVKQLSVAGVVEVVVF